MFVFVSLLLCMGSFMINGGLTSGLKEDANMTVTSSSCHDKERQTLLLLGLNRTLYDCCHWPGVGCDKHTGHVNRLDLQYYGYYRLLGNITPLLSLLPQLKYLHLSGIDCQLNPIPNSLSSLTNLQDLRISYANLSGSIPHQLANLSKLLSLDLSGNSLSGPIPVALGELTSLESLDLSGNQLEGDIPKSFGNSSSLIQLDLSENLLNGSVPNFVGCSYMKETISNAKYVYDGQFDKYMVGSLIGSPGCPSLHMLDLSKNGLTGNLPNSMHKLVNLEYLDVSSNSLESVISDVHFQNLTKLTYLDLSFNSFTLNLSSNARIPFSLETIKMQSCKLGPSFPMWIQTQRSFAYLDISNNGISDRIPAWLWDLPPGLRFLNLSSNEIKGTLPDITSVFARYPGMDLSNNQLEGTIPVLPYKLAALNLSGNRFSGTLSFLCQIDDVGLTFLDLSNNFLSGGVPDCLKFRKRLVVLNLSNNSLSGEIPSLGLLFNLQALYLRQNDFSGAVPMSLRNCTNLRFLDLGENKLSGNIPTWIGETLSELYVLVLRSNRFNGSLPSQLCLLNNLQVLDLSKNGLSENIPRCFRNFTAMTTRRFQDDIMSHSYSSFVPSVMPYNSLIICPPNERICFWDDKALFIDNALVEWKGTQREFGRSTLHLLKSIDISSNKLYGKLPYEITNLRGLVSLNFSNNKLHGEIPTHMGRLRFLESLDLSRNEFSGSIPSSLSQITPLSYLDLSYNNLSGRILLVISEQITELTIQLNRTRR